VAASSGSRAFALGHPWQRLCSWAPSSYNFGYSWASTSAPARSDGWGGAGAMPAHPHAQLRCRVPEEALHLYMSYIDAPRDTEPASLVCRRWHNLASAMLSSRHGSSAGFRTSSRSRSRGSPAPPCTGSSVTTGMLFSYAPADTCYRSSSSTDTLRLITRYWSF
jgi:hypothetical protein